MMINDDWSPWLVSVLRLPQVKHLQRDKIKRIFDDLCGPKWEFTKQPAWFRKDMKRHGTSTMLQQLPKKKMRFTHPIGAISWDGTTTRAALGPKKQCIHRGWFLRFLWLHISASGSAFGRVTVGVEWWTGGSKDPNFLGRFSPPETNMAMENPRFQDVSLIVKRWIFHCHVRSRGCSWQHGACLEKLLSKRSFWRRFRSSGVLNTMERQVNSTKSSEKWEISFFNKGNYKQILTPL